MAFQWTKTSAPPPSTEMKPKPLSALNHLTVPCATNSPCKDAQGAHLNAPGHTSGGSGKEHTVSAPDQQFELNRRSAAAATQNVTRLWARRGHDGQDGLVRVAFDGFSPR